MQTNMYESGEMYLETILSIKNEKGYVRSVDLILDYPYHIILYKIILKSIFAYIRSIVALL